MAYDEGLAQRVRELLTDESDVVERRMFGGLAFMVGGHMTFGILGSRGMARLGNDGAALALDEPHVSPMDFTGKNLRSMVFLEEEAIAEDDDLAGWVTRALTFVRTLEPKS